MLRLADFQVRLLLCTPTRKLYCDDGRARLAWRCGCTALEMEEKMFAVWPCRAHEFLLMQVPERASTSV
jgi:hypothetical protein